MEMYNRFMPQFRFYYPIEVRYGDLDPQGHVNNAKYLTYIEHARIAYIRSLGLWNSDSFLEIGMILAEARVTYLTPILYTHQVSVGVRVTRIGNKSMAMDYSLEDRESGAVLATGSAVLVSYDYRTSKTKPVPANWREAIETYEELPAATHL